VLLYTPARHVAAGLIAACVVFVDMRELVCEGGALSRKRPPTNREKAVGIILSIPRIIP
jgi:hypothetical protein